MNYVCRINLNVDCKDRKQLIDFCLNSEKQFIAIGWTKPFEINPSIKTYQEYYEILKTAYKGKRRNPAHNIFLNARTNDLFWTRDLDGMYWICRAKGLAQSMYIEDIGVGAVIPVEAYKYDIEVPGQIKASFNRQRGGTCEYIKDKIIQEFSKKAYNDMSGECFYELEKIDGCLLDNLPDFDLEELVISYIQLHENYYLVSNSIANKSTTIKIECEFISRNKNLFKKAVVQVKGGKSKTVDAGEYTEFDKKGYTIYLYAPYISNKSSLKNMIEITRNDLLSFYEDYKSILPKSITKWEDLFN